MFNKCTTIDEYPRILHGGGSRFAMRDIKWRMSEVSELLPAWVDNCGVRLTALYEVT